MFQDLCKCLQVHWDFSFMPLVILKGKLLLAQKAVSYDSVIPFNGNTAFYEGQ